MIVGETTYYFPIALGILSIIAFSYIGTWLSQKFYTLSSQAEHSISIQTITTTFLLGAVLIGLCIFGIRGRRGYNPIKVSQAYYCNDPFLNQIGVNPVFNLLTSYIDDNRKENRALTLMNDEKAINKVQELLNRGGIEGLSPIARNVMAESGPSRKNVVMILMESMSAHLMSAYGNTGNLTPFLDSLYKESLTFKNFYSSGIHTNHGMYSTLYSFPAIMKRNAMKGSVIPIYSGLPTVLKANGYHNSFFMTHESQ
jgi:phosphoglycerol transferase MdoB-like AlkP superfamily enzyme